MVVKMPEALPMCWGAMWVTTALWVAGMGHRDPGAGDDQRGDELGVGEVRAGDHRDPAHAKGLQEQPAGDERSFADRLDPLAGDRRDEEQRRCPGEELQSGIERAVSLGGLQELRHEVHGSEQRRGHEEGRGVAR